MRIAQKDIFFRQKEILDYLKLHTYCRNEELSSKFNLSISTVRRYVQQMEEQRYIKRYRGGIILNNQEPDAIPYSIYSTRNKNEKSAIMKYVADHLIDSHDTVFINGSSTALYLYMHLKKSATIVTNNAKVLFTDYADKQNLILIGGQPSSHNGENILCGEFALNMISSINASAAILGVSGINAEVGLTSSSPQDIAINKAMLSRTRGKKIVVADYSKIGRIFNFSFSSLKGITHLVTDSRADKNELEKMKAANIEVITVNPDENVD